MQSSSENSKPLHGSASILAIGQGLDLTGYYKLYALKKSIHIVYRIIDQKVLVEVVAIGRREDLVVYQEALKRLKHRDR